MFVQQLLKTNNNVFFISFQPGNDPYAFVELVDGSSAAAALAAFNKRMVLGKVSLHFPCLDSRYNKWGCTLVVPILDS